MKNLRSNHGATLIELICSIAVLSIVGLASFTLLMFSIRTNNYIVEGSASSKDADLFNSRFALFLEDKVGFEPSTDGSFAFSLAQTEGDATVPTVTLSVSEDKLLCGEEVFCENISQFQIIRISDTRLIRVSYTIGDRSYSKLFRLQDPPQTS